MTVDRKDLDTVQTADRESTAQFEPNASNPSTASRKLNVMLGNEQDDTEEALAKIETDPERSLTGAELGDLLRSRMPTQADRPSRQKSPSALVLNEFFGESAI